jgi:MFS family permease
MRSAVSPRWICRFPKAGYVASQVLILAVLVWLFVEPGVSTPPEFWEIGWTFVFVFVLALIPALVVGALAGASRLLGGTVLALLVRVGATLLVIVLGAWISLLVMASTFSLYEEPVDPGKYLGLLLGTESSLALSWLVASGTTRLLERRRGRVR